MKILLAITGGIAAYKAPKIVSLLRERGHEVRVIATANGLRFVSSLTLSAMSGHPVLSDLFEGPGDSEMNHIRFPEWADVVLVAPASANILAKAARGIADDMVSTLLLATGTGSHSAAPVVYVPAMNTRMWHHAATQANIGQLLEWGGKVMDPAAGRLACTDEGEGRMPEPEDIIRQLEQWGLLTSPSPES